MTTREQAIEALFALIERAYAWNATTRRLINPTTIAPSGGAAFALVTERETYERPSPSQPAKRIINATAAIYANVAGDPSAVPDQVLNNIEDALDAALVADNPATGRCTLGGLVFSAMIKGEIVRGIGDKSGLPMSLVPIEIIVP